MGVDYTAILAIGKEFDERSEAEYFLIDNKIVTEEELEEAEGIGEWLWSQNKFKLDGGYLNHYSGNGFYIGFDISCRSPEIFAKDFSEGMEEWDKLFPNTPAEVVHTVCVS